MFGILMVVLLQRARDGVWPWIARLLPQRAPPPVPDAEPLPARDQAPRDGAAARSAGGAQAVRRPGRRQRPVVRDPARRDPRPHRTERRRQEHDVQPDLRRARRSPSGDVVFRGESIGGRLPYEIARRGIGRTFQHVKLVPQMSVLDNVALGAYLRGSAGVVRAALRLDRRGGGAHRRPRRRARSRAWASARTRSTPAGSLPLGKQRIVEIARALAADPALLLLDEPAAGLRYLEKQELAALLRATESARA